MTKAVNNALSDNAFIVCVCRLGFCWRVVTVVSHWGTHLHQGPRTRSAWLSMVGGGLVCRRLRPGNSKSGWSPTLCIAIFLEDIDVKCHPVYSTELRKCHLLKKNKKISPRGNFSFCSPPFIWFVDLILAYRFFWLCVFYSPAFFYLSKDLKFLLQKMSSWAGRQIQLNLIPYYYISEL